MTIVFPEMPGLTKDQVLTLSRVRTYKQYLTLLESYQKGACAFCDPMDMELNPIIQRNHLWRMWVNPFPQKHTKCHLIMAPKRYVGPEDSFLQEDLTAAGDLFFWARSEFKLKGGGFVLRFGSPLDNAGSVLHLHANIIVPDGTGDVSVALAKSAIRIEHGFDRLRVFEKLRKGLPLEALSAGELALVSGYL